MRGDYADRAEGCDSTQSACVRNYKTVQLSALFATRSFNFCGLQFAEAYGAAHGLITATGIVYVFD